MTARPKTYLSPNFYCKQRVLSYSYIPCLKYINKIVWSRTAAGTGTNYGISE